jgi:hypothetical protein
MPTVFVVSNSAHDFNEAKKFGKLVFLSEGAMNRYHCNNQHRQFNEYLKKSTSEDYLLLCGLSVMNSIACATFAVLHGRLNLLLFRKGRYVERNIVLNKNDKEKEND